MADVFLSSGETYTVANNNTRVFGTNGTSDAVTVLTNITGLVLDQNIETVRLSGAASDYRYKQSGNQLEVYAANGTTLITRIPLQGDADGTGIQFGSSAVVSAVLSDTGVMTLGGSTVSATTVGAVTPGAGGTSDTSDTVVDIQLFDDPDYWRGDMFVTDLNGDGVDEIIVAGRKSQPSTVADWQDSYVSVLGWNTGSFANENTKWFEAGNNKILGTEPNVRFGDFDGNGYQDVWVAPSTDMRHYGPGIVYFNDGEKLQRYDVDIGHVWAHDSAVADINNDGLDDIVASSYGPGQVIALGRVDKTFDIYKGPASVNYSGIAAGDFLGDGSVSFVMVDSWGDGVSDTVLYQLTVPQPDQSPVFTQRAVLPADRFYQPKWDHATWLKQPGNLPHSVRATTMDFNRDGLDDVIISTSGNGSDGTWHRYFEIQFLENQGNGVFIDQTDNILLDWDPLTTVSYNPQVRDINGDGMADIWLSAQDYQNAENSNRVLIAGIDGTFTQELQSELLAMRNTVGGKPAPVAWLEGPDQTYLAALSWQPDHAWAQVRLIGETIV